MYKSFFLESFQKEKTTDQQNVLFDVNFLIQ